MPRKYSNELKKKVVELIKTKDLSTKDTAYNYNIPLKTLEKWITAYNKDKTCFDSKEEDN